MCAALFGEQPGSWNETNTHIRRCDATLPCVRARVSCGAPHGAARGQVSDNIARLFVDFLMTYTKREGYD